MLHLSESTAVDIDMGPGERRGQPATDVQLTLGELRRATAGIGSAIEAQTAMVADVKQAVDDLAGE